MPQDRRPELQHWSDIATLGIFFVVATIVGLGIGLYLDGLFNTSPWLTIIFLFFGIAAGFKNFFEVMKRESREP